MCGRSEITDFRESRTFDVGLLVPGALLQVAKKGLTARNVALVSLYTYGTRYLKRLQNDILGTCKATAHTRAPQIRFKNQISYLWLAMKEGTHACKSPYKILDNMLVSIFFSIPSFPVDQRQDLSCDLEQGSGLLREHEDLISLAFNMAGGF